MLNSEFMRVINEKHIMTKQKIVSVLVIIFIFVLSINSLSQDTSTVNPNFAKANEAFKDRDYDLAVQLYKNLLDGELDVSMEAKILNNLGLTYKAQKRFDDATETFQRILSGKANDLEPGGHIMEAYRNYRPKAQWEIGNCFLLSGNYKKALNAYQITKSKHPFRSWCGNAKWEYDHKYNLYQAVCLEWLNRSDEAVALYWGEIAFGFHTKHIISARLLDLYTETGSTKQLLVMLDEVDNAWRDLLNKESISLTDEEFKKARPTRSIRRMLEIREMGKNEQWALLIPLLKSNSISAPLGTNDLEMHWVSVLAVNQLIKKPEVTVPLLLAEVKEGNNNNWLYYALGQCGTPKALDAVEARILNVKNIYTISGCVFSLSQAGEEGEKRISKLAETATANLKIAIENSHNRQYAHLYSRERQYHFPVISQDIELSATWIEVETLIESVNKYAAGGKLGNESYRKLVDGLDAGLSFTEKTTPQEKTAFRILRKETIPAIGKSILPYLWYKAEYSSEEDVVEYCIGAIMDIEGLSKTNEKEFEAAFRNDFPQYKENVHKQAYRVRVVNYIKGFIQGCRVNSEDSGVKSE